MKITSELRVVQPDEASRWLEEYPFSRQRGKKEAQIERLTEAMRKKTFKQGTQIHIAQLGDNKFIINGQHTLTALKISGCPQMLDILTTVCDSENEINHLYAVEDRHSIRTAGDVLKAHNLSAELDLTVGVLRQALSSIRFIQGGFFGSVQGRVFMDDLQTAQTLREYSPAIKRFYRAMSGSQGSVRVGLQRSSTQGPMLAVLMGDKQREAIDFITSIAQDDYDEAEPVIKAMQIHMVESYMPSGRAVHRVKGMHSSEAARVVAAGWNAFVENKEYRQPESHERAEPINLLYTPYLNSNATY